jgi:hypothetical protein
MENKKFIDKYFVHLIFLIFLLLAYIFANSNLWLAPFERQILTISGEISVSRNKTQKGPSSKYSHKKNSQKKKQSTASKSSNNSKIDRSIQVLADYPKTKQPEIMFVNGKPDYNNLPPFPPIRKYDGTEWTIAKTDIRMATDGKKLYVFIKCFDNEPENLDMNNTQKDKRGDCWLDDSIELFLMKERSNKKYSQYVVSAAGGFNIINRGGNAQIENTILKGNPQKDGYTVYMVINLSDIGIDKLKPGDQLLMQVVRNYRGQNSNLPGALILHLFPVHVYGDKRFGFNNHDTRAFQPAKVIAP